MHNPCRVNLWCATVSAAPVDWLAVFGSGCGSEQAAEDLDPGSGSGMAVASEQSVAVPDDSLISAGDPSWEDVVSEWVTLGREAAAEHVWEREGPDSDKDPGVTWDVSLRTPWQTAAPEIRSLA